ncbi:TIGR02285 family protein [Salidesulfovibrio brasiliensis]|uniref:TIGR02285 family protein n=1 Tax=Salidesulfovibrio brasiliensis TaxID=221711 RepID=UPI0006D2063E|nr:TIGR02285 family protein [Salidesulfovibrio brasiliensis]
MKKNVKYISFALIVMLFYPSQGWTKDKVTWLVSNFPPIHIAEGSFSGKGYGDYVTDLLIENLPEYKHEKIQSNFIRSLEMLKQKERVVHPALLKRADREKYILFSIPTYVHFPSGLLILKNHLKLFEPFMDSEGRVSLEDILVHSQMKVGVAAERAYGSSIDELLLKYRGHANIVISHKVYLLADIIAMLLSQRLDCALGYPEEGRFVARTMNRDEDLIWLPVQGMPEYVLSYVGFPDDEWGKVLAERVNAILRKHRNTSEFHAAYEYWLDRASVKRYRENMDIIESVQGLSEKAVSE